MPVPFKVRSVFEYKSEEPDDLKFSVGQIITVTDDDDADWYTGEYEGTSGKVEGLFPRNFVERYEPPIPSRPVRSVPKPAPPPVAPVEAPSRLEVKAEPPPPVRSAEAVEDTKPRTSTEQRPIENKPVKQPPPPVAEKPASGSFRDRIAAFNKPAAAPITPFKSSGGSTAGFIKKPFVAPPPSRNSYVPPAAQAPAATKIYRREEDSELTRHDEEDLPATAEGTREEPVLIEDQPKPTSLKDRIALLQQQQLEQAQRVAEKKKVKKPLPPQRTESTDNDVEKVESTEAPITRQETELASSKESVDIEHDDEDDEQESVRKPEHDVAIPTVVPAPARELVSDTNDADDSGAGDTEDAQETSTEEDRRISKSIKSPPMTSVETSQTSLKNMAEEPAAEEEEGEEGTEDEDPEVRRRREIRDRMAKMSGGMGMMGMFGPMGGMSAPPKKPKAAPRPEKSATEPHREEEVTRAPPVPIMALPGMSTRATQQEEGQSEGESTSPTPMDSSKKGAPDEDYVSHQPVRTSVDRSGPTSPLERAAPPPPPRETRAPPPVSSIPPIPQSPPGRSNLPPPPPPPTRDDTREYGEPPQSPISGRNSLDNKPSRQLSTRKEPSAMPPGAPPPPPARTLTSDSFTSTHSVKENRASRAPPPPPTAAPISPQSRAPPPPPPGQPPSRSTTSGSLGHTSKDNVVDDESEDEVTEYDGDYDTDIASGAKHKDALKAHNRDSSVEDEGVLTDEPSALPSSPPTRAVPPLPPTMPPRDVPPPPPSAPKSRPSHDVPRAMPPPIPSAAAPVQSEGDDSDDYEFSARQYDASSPPQPPFKSPPVPFTPEQEEDEMYGAPSYAPPPMPPPRQQAPPMPTERAMPPRPPTERAAPPPPPQSLPPMMAGALGSAPVPPQTTAPTGGLDITRTPTVSKRSIEQTRPSADFGFMAADIDLSEASLWWTHDNTAPPSIAARSDMLFEVESNTSTKRGGKTTVTRDVYILYMDYSQSTINVSFDPNDPSSATISQSHQRPPPPPRQDQLESVSHSFGKKITSAASQAAGTTVADGSTAGFIWTILQPLRSNALMPVGNRSFGAVVYSNLANASTQQFDEIRPGDIITFRNAKFAGHKGGLHQKYTLEAGAPGRDHIAVVIDWDGTKKKIRAWEQGRDEKKGTKGKVKEESFRIGDLKSGEVKVWRVMSRSWVGWDSS